MAYENQGHSLRAVQLFGPSLESQIRNFLGWANGRVVYFKSAEPSLRYDVQLDSCYPDVLQPTAFVSVTYCNPDKPGHSNENKLQLKVGELMLLKAEYPSIKSILVVGGNQHAWLPYVLQVFKYFFDEVIFMWEDNSLSRLEHVRDKPDNVALKHEKVWQKIKQEWQTKKLSVDKPIDSRLRLGIWELAQRTGREGDLPSDISNSIMRHCMQTAYDVSVKTRNRSGKEWGWYFREDWSSLWQSRSFFNPAEAAIDLSLSKAGFAYAGGLAVDVEVPSLLHSLGGTDVARTKVSEDFILFSQKYNQPVFIQSKSSGGGKEVHGKNIQNRAKEQLTRSLIYRGSINAHGDIELRNQDFIWISLLDGNWGVTKATPLKYIHMLQWGGYQYLLASDSLVDSNYELLPIEINPLVNILKELNCYTSQEAFTKVWKAWLKERVKKITDKPTQLLPTLLEPVYEPEQQSFEDEDV